MVLERTGALVVGVDEAGRGPLAGPVSVAAVALPDGFDITGIHDSKQLSESQRAAAFTRIREQALWAIELSEPDEIDRLNILHATMAAMCRSIERLGFEPELALIDGNKIPPGLGCAAEAVVKGDGKYACIAAASILAKVTRDRLMVEYASQYPQYGFDKHFGYPTPEHLAALREYGPCPIHRRSYAPVQEAALQPCLIFEA
ncbi:MAG: ribonuclease HII [Fimbriimonadaceae bacterium]|nr:ribonuclease HII [Fimbriimonadaceae bacterium]